MNKKHNKETEKEITKIIGTHPTDKAPYKIYEWRGKRITEEEFLEKIKARQ